jgi:hypothetical protein
MNSKIVVGIAVVAIILGSAYYMGWFGQEAPKAKSTTVKPPEEQEVYVGTQGGEPIRPRDACEALCREKLDQGMDLSDGPCLGMITEGWVCDVAHDPRADVDNDPANQCPEYGKTANHYVEVDPSCNLIKEA